jgi:hypothetical protein
VGGGELGRTLDLLLEAVWKEEGCCCCCEPDDEGVSTRSFFFLVLGLATFCEKKKKFVLLREKEGTI